MSETTSQPSNSISRQLLQHVFLLSLVLTLIFTVLLAIVDYRTHLSSFNQQMDDLQRTQVPGISAALWGYDRQTLHAQMEGILHSPFIRYVAVRDRNEFLMESGKKLSESFVERNVPLTRDYNGRGLVIGSITVQADTSRFLEEIFNKVVVIFLVQLLIVTIISSFLVLLFNSLVTRHLARAAEYFRSFDLGFVSTPLQLDKKNRGDEIDSLLGSFNVMQEKLAKTYGQLSEREQTLRESERRLHLATASARLGVWDWDIARDRLTWDDRMFEMYGIAKERFQVSVGEWEEAVHPDDRSRVVAALGRAMHGEEDFNVEFRVVRADGTVREIKANGLTVRDARGGAVRMIGLNRDITEQKQADKALIAAELKYRRLLESVQLLAVMLDIDGNITFCNDYLLNLTGRSRSDVLGRNWFDLFIPPDEKETVANVFMANISREEMFHFQNSIIGRNNRKRLIAWNNSLLKDPDGNIIGMASIGTDLTDQRRMEEQLRQSLKMESIGRLAGGVAHDFNNMLSVIMGNTELAMLHLREGDPLMEKMKAISTAADRSRKITRQLLAFSRKEIISPKPVDVNSLIRETGKTLTHLIGEDITIVFRPGEGLWNILIDSSQMDQILVNLAVNARDAMPKGGKLVLETANIHLDDFYCSDFLDARPGDFVLVTVSDDGAGMDRETKQHIFEPFFTTKSVGKGTGLGLATVYGIVTQNRGFITVYSEPGQGSTFKLYFPRMAGPGEHQPAPQPSAFTGTGTVLLVEDEKPVRDITATMLEQMGYTVLQAESAEAALSICDGASIDILLTDVVMPGKSGKDLYEEVSRNMPGLKVMFMSGYTAELIAQRAVLEEDVHFIQKPFDMKTLNLKMIEALAAPKNAPAS